MAKAANKKEEKEVFQKTSFSVRPSYLQKVKYIVLIEKSSIQEVVDEGLKAVVDRFEKENGPIPVK